MLIEIEDECGGLRGGNGQGFFRPFEAAKRGSNRLGLGLAFSRWGAEDADDRVEADELYGDGRIPQPT